MLVHLQNFKAGFRLDHVGDRVLVHFEDHILELRRKLAALEGAEFAAILRRRALRMSLRQLCEILAVHELLVQVVRLRFDGRNLFRSLALRVEENFGKLHLLRANELLLVIVVILLDLVGADVHAPAHFLLDHFLRQQAVFQLLLVVFPDDPLLLDGLLQIVHGREVVLFADFVEPLHHVGLDVDVHVLGALDQKLLVDHVAQQVLLPLFVLLPASDPACSSGNPGALRSGRSCAAFS